MPTSPESARRVLDPNDQNQSLHSSTNIRYINVTFFREEKGWSPGFTKWALYSFGPDKGRGQSAIVSAYQQFDGRWALAGQWSRSFERLSSDYRELASGAVLWLEPFSRSHDILGLGAFVGDPSDSSRGSESGGEIFYRLQVSQGTHLMPSLQYWSEDDADSDREAWVAGLRLNFEF